VAWLGCFFGETWQACITWRIICSMKLGGACIACAEQAVMTWPELPRCLIVGMIGMYDIL